MKHRIILILLAGLLFASFINAEEDFLAQVKKKFSVFQQKNLRVKVYLSFNQEVYSPGDTAFFQARFMTESLMPVGGKQILSLDVVDASGQVVEHENFSVKDGLGSNQIVISKKISPGLYTFIAYSEWMRNFEKDLFFQKPVIIAGHKEIIASPDSDTSVQFFPEGGHLVTGVANKVVIYAPGKTDFKITDGEGTELTTCTIHNSGLGFFMLTPQAGKTYQATSGTSSWPVPAGEDGIAVHTTASEKGEAVRIVLETPANSPYRNKNIYLIVAAQNAIQFTATLKFDENPLVQVLVPQANLPQGVARLSVLDASGEVLTERLFYIAQQEPDVTIGTDKKIYSPREKVALEISMTDEMGNGVAGDFSLSVTAKKLFPKTNHHTIKETFLLTSDLGYSDHAFLNKSNEGWFGTLDLFLITKKWRGAGWHDILTETSEPKKFSFKNTLNLAGQAVDPSTGKPVADSTLIMVYLQNYMMGYETHTTQNGAFDLSFLFDFWGRDEVFYVMESKRKELPNAVITVFQEPVTFDKGIPWRETELPDPYGEFSLRKVIADRSYSFYTTQDQKGEPRQLNANAEFEDEVTGVDVSINMEDYVVFPTMEDVIREVIPSLQYRKIGGKPAIRVLLSEVNINPHQGDPLYIIDGIMTKNTDYFLKMKPQDIITVKIVKDVNKLSRFGALGKNGMVLIQTKKTDEKLKEQSALLPVEGLSKPLHFTLPAHAQKENERIPDFRSTLYWNPQVKTNTEGKASLNFYLSDNTGTLLIKLEGMTAEGKPISKTSEIEVVFNSARH